MKTQKLTIKRIAELAGVSKATVSRVLNHYPHISAEVHERVMTVVNETGYQRNQVARMLASDRSHMIGLVIPSGAQAIFTDPYFPVLTRGITLAAKSSHLTLALFLCESEQEGVETIRSILANGLLDGIIITADYKNNTFESDLLNNEMPYVFIGRPQQVENVSYIDSDNFAGGFTATEYLITQGYQRIAIIGSSKNTSGDDRYQGYCAALEKHGIVYDASLVTHGDYSMDSGTRCMIELLSAQPDAVFVTSDTMALGAIRALREQNILVPDQIAIVGHDDLPPAIQADPQLTTIRQQIATVGELAVETLLQIIENPERPLRQLSLPVELIVRASTKAHEPIENLI
ncbi:MAG: LacI family DNA-binding transcriptional regulator [Phototrophicaceae bacterium]|jgi:LacI family transcriptional regulator